MKAFAAVLVPCLTLFWASVSFGFTFDPKVPAEIQSQMNGDLAFINTVESSSASDLHKQIYGGVNGADYTRFFETRVTAVGMNGCGDPQAVACVIPFIDSSKMWLTKNYINFSHPQIARLMIIFHESRHTEVENGNYSHAYCPKPFLDANGNEIKSIWTGASLAGKAGCDATPFGSYGSTTIMLKNIQKFCTNCGEKVLMDAGIYGDDQFKRMIDKRAIEAMKKDLYSN